MNTFLLHKIHQKINFNKITQWFHTRIEGKELEGTPAQTIMDMNDLFINLLKEKKLNLGVSEKIFRRNMCTALCTMKYYGDTNICKHGPVGRYPAEWTDDVESMWQEWLEVRSFHYWAAFWARLPLRAWEEDLPGWRSAMEHLLLLYVQREVNVLVDADIIVEDDNGDYVDSNQYEHDADRWD